MSIVHRHLLVPAAALAVALACGGSAVAQDRGPQAPSEFESWQLPGWSFTPGVTFGGLYDSNVALAPPDVNKKTAGDTLLTIQPFGMLEFFNPRTSFSSGYHGLLQRYITLSGLDDSDQRAFASLRERLTRRVTLYFSDNYAQVATTDQLQLNGVPFRRMGGRYNDFAGGVEARLSRTNDLAVRVESTWVDFARKQDVDLTGGIVNGVDLELSHRFTERLSLGGEYDVRLANLNGALRSLLFQEVGGTFHYRVTDVTAIDAAAGAAHLVDRDRNLMRSGPYVKLDLLHRMSRATIGATYRRSYVPSLAFGGTNQSQEVTGFLNMPFRKNRFYVQEAAAWRRTDPFLSTELPLSSIWAQNLVGYAISRWFRIEGYYQFTGQDNRLVQGKVTRNLAGVQFVVAQPMRIR